MTARRPCPPAPRQLEDYAVHFDPLFHALAQRHSFRTYLAGLLAPRDRHKTLTALAGAEPLVQAQAAPVQQLQFFLSESTWEADAVTARTLQLLGTDSLTASNADGVLVIDDTGDRKDGCATDHVARQYLGSVGKIDNGINAVTTLWAHELRYYPLHVMPYTPECRLVGGKQNPAFQTKPQIALSLVERALAAGIAFKAIVADCFYGDNHALEAALRQRGLPYVLAHRGTVGRGWAPTDIAHSFEDAARELPLRAWHKIARRFRDGHAERWWAAELTLFGYGPDRPVRAVCATIDRKTLPELSTWYLTTDLPAERARHSPPLGAGVLRLCLLLVAGSGREVRLHEATAAPVRKKNRAIPAANAMLLAAPAAHGASVVDAGRLAQALLARLRRQVPACRTGCAARLPQDRLRHQPVSPVLTNYR